MISYFSVLEFPKQCFNFSYRPSYRNRKSGITFGFKQVKNFVRDKKKRYVKKWRLGNFHMGVNGADDNTNFIGWLKLTRSSYTQVHMMWLKLSNNNWSDIYSKSYTKSGFEPTLQLTLRDFLQNIWSRVNSALTRTIYKTSKDKAWLYLGSDFLMCISILGLTFFIWLQAILFSNELYWRKHK